MARTNELLAQIDGVGTVRVGHREWHTQQTGTVRPLRQPAVALRPGYCSVCDCDVVREAAMHHEAVEWQTSLAQGDPAQAWSEALRVIQSGVLRADNLGRCPG